MSVYGTSSSGASPGVSTSSISGALGSSNEHAHNDTQQITTATIDGASEICHGRGMRKKKRVESKDNLSPALLLSASFETSKAVAATVGAYRWASGA